MSKTAKYIVAIALLLVANLWLLFSGSTVDTKTSTKYFNTEDLDGVSGFKFIQNGDTVSLSLTEDGWIVNSEYLADQGFVNTLISVLERVEVGRTIENFVTPLLGKVEVEFDFNSRYRFDFATNPNKTRSYFVSESGAKEVAVPGYRDNVVDIFTLHPDQWRDRLVLNGSWRTLQKVSINNSQGENFEIAFADKFFLVNKEAPSDTSAVVDYLNQFQQFQANEMISEGRFEELDSIALTDHFAEVLIDDIQYEQPIELRIFKSGTNQSYNLVKDHKGQSMVIDARRIRQILTNPNRPN